MTVKFEKYNKIVRFMAKNFDEVADKFSKKDGTCYVVCRKNITNGEPVVVAYYKTAKGAQGYINRICLSRHDIIWRFSCYSRTCRGGE